jgi:hypothetical protein
MPRVAFKSLFWLYNKLVLANEYSYPKSPLNSDAIAAYLEELKIFPEHDLQ